MHLAIFGAAGQTGQPLVAQALAAGHTVTAFVRNPAQLITRPAHLTVVPGDATDLDAVERAVAGANAVISVLATSGTQAVAHTRPLTRSTQNILAAMHKYGVRRLVQSAAGLPQPGDAADLRFQALMAFVKLIAPASHADTTGSVQVVRASDVDWTIVRMPLPTNAPPTGQVQAGPVSAAIGMRIARADAAAFMLREVQAAQYLRQAPVVCSRAKRP